MDQTTSNSVFLELATTSGHSCNSLTDFYLIIVAYLIGSVPFGLILTRVFLQKDIRNEGSGNIGTTNVLRAGNKFLALLTLLLDMLKAMAVIYFFTMLSKTHCYGTDSALLTGLFAVLGHCFPIWLKFKGGKGVATALGALLAAVPFSGLAAAGAWLLTAFLFKISSLAALVAFGVAPIVTFFVYGAAPATVCFLITLLVWFRHKDNIKRLMAGTEPKIGAK